VLSVRDELDSSVTAAVNKQSKHDVEICKYCSGGVMFKILHMQLYSKANTRICVLYFAIDSASATSTLLRLILFFNKSDGRYVHVLLIFRKAIVKSYYWQVL